MQMPVPVDTLQARLATCNRAPPVECMQLPAALQVKGQAAPSNHLASNQGKRYKRVKKTVVEIFVSRSRVRNRDGIVMALMDRDIVVLTSDHDISSEGVEVFIPNQGAVKDVTILASRAGIAILLCRDLTPDQQRELAEVKLFEGDLQEFQEVYTYSHQNKYRVLTPGNIMSLYDSGFDHSCSAHPITQYGSPVFNEDAQLVGMCFNFSEYVSSYNIAEIARKVDNNLEREYTSVQLSLQNLRQQIYLQG